MRTEPPERDLMTTTGIDVSAALRRSAVRATRAPSVHNTQPWRFVLSDGRLEVRADWARRLRILDPTGRQLLLSCGCAVFNARVALASEGLAADVDRYPDAARPDLVAIIDATSESVDDAFARLDAAIETRQSNRRSFDHEAVPEDVVATLVDAARAEGAELFEVTHETHRRAVARLSQRADGIENAQPAYRAELRRWTTDDPGRVDGVPASAVPRIDEDSVDEVPIRDFDTHASAELPARTESSAQQCLLLLGTNADNAGAWIRAGEALERVLLEITRQGYAASMFTQVIEVPSTRALLRAELGITMYPHILIRVGRAQPIPPTRRRRLVDVIIDSA
jgi:hypothetical protein